MMNFFQFNRQNKEKAICDALEILRIIEEKGLREMKLFGGDSISITDIELRWIVYTLVVMEEIVH